jgi:hypothetical protein
MQHSWRSWAGTYAVCCLLQAPGACRRARQLAVKHRKGCCMQELGSLRMACAGTLRKPGMIHALHPEGNPDRADRSWRRIRARLS